MIDFTAQTATAAATAAAKDAASTAFSLAGKAFEGLEQLSTLNLQLAKTVLAETKQQAFAALSAKGLDELVALQTAAAQGLAPKATAYGRQVSDIVNSVVDAYRSVFEKTAADFQGKSVEALTTALKDLPGKDQALALVRSASDAAKTAYDSVNQASKQVSESVAKLAEAA